MSYPNPILNLDFVNSKQLGDKVAFSRSSPATFWDRNGVLRTAIDGMPRFDHDPLTGICKGLLVEPQVSFLETYSEQFDNALWLKARANIVANAAVAPDGTTTADKFREDASTTGTHTFYNSRTIVAGSSQCAYIFAKAGEITKGQIRIYGSSGNGQGVSFDLIAGTCFVGAIGTASTLSSYGMIYVGGGYYFVWVSCIFNATDTTATVQLITLDDSWVMSYTSLAGSTKGFYIWGMKFFPGTCFTSYLPSVASVVTRSYDNASVDLSNLKGFSGESLWNGGGGAVVVDFSPYPLGRSDLTYPRLFQLHNGAEADSITILYVPSLGRFNVLVYKNNVLQADMRSDGWSMSVGHKLQLSFDTNDIRLYVDGVLAVSDTSCEIPVTTSAVIGGRVVGSAQACAHFRFVQLYNRSDIPVL